MLTLWPTPEWPASFYKYLLLSEGYEDLSDSSESVIRLAMINRMLRRLKPERRGFLHTLLASDDSHAQSKFK